MTALPQIAPAFQVNGGMESLEARAAVLKGIQKERFAAYDDLLNEEIGLTNDLAELNRNIARYGKGICPECDQLATARLARLRDAWTEINHKRQQVHEQGERALAKLRETDSELNTLLTDIHIRLIRSRQEKTGLRMI